MSYGHAERNLASAQRLSRETAQLLRSLSRLDSRQTRWLRDVELQFATSRAAGRKHDQTVESTSDTRAPQRHQQG